MQQNITFRKSPPSLESLSDGQIVFAMEPNKGVCMYTRQAGQIWLTEFNNKRSVKALDNIKVRGDSTFDRKLIVNKLEARNLSYNKFIDYRMFGHNFKYNLTTASVFLPWQTAAENTGPDMDDDRNALLVPFRMTLYKLLFRSDRITTYTANITFSLVKQDERDQVEDTIASYRYIGGLTEDGTHIINSSDWILEPSYDSPTVEVGNKVGLKMTPETDPAGDISWYITSVWKIEVDLS